MISLLADLPSAGSASTQYFPQELACGFTYAQVPERQIHIDETLGQRFGDCLLTFAGSARKIGAVNADLHPPN